MALDSKGNLYIADSGNNVIRKITKSADAKDLAVAYSSAIITTLISGSGRNALSGPQGVAVDADDNIYIADSGNSRIVEATLAPILFT
jgi:DNA-binding beta-propeller fold protein YncE